MTKDKRRYKGRVLMLSTHGYVGQDVEFGKPDTGGQVVYVIEMARRFTRLGYKVDLATRQFEKQSRLEKVNDGFNIVRIPFGGRDFIRKEDMHDHIDAFITNLLVQIRKKGLVYDVVYSHYWDAGYAGQKLAEELRIPHVHTPHSLGWWKKHNMPGKKADLERTYRFEERIRKEFLVYRTCDHVIATTTEQADILTDEYGMLDRSVSVIPAGMDEGRFCPVPPVDRDAIRKRLGLREHDVLALGRMATNKGFDLLIKALPTLRQLVPRARLIAGFGGTSSARDKKKIDKLKRLASDIGVARKIRWIGYIEDDVLADYYRGAGVFALCSRYEPFGMTAIEAMACGTPTVVSVHGGLFEHIRFGEQAVYADPKRPIEYGTMLAMPMLHATLADELSVEGARFARRTFGWTGIARRTIALFEQYAARYKCDEDEILP